MSVTVLWIGLASSPNMLRANEMLKLITLSACRYSRALSIAVGSSSHSFEPHQVAVDTLRPMGSLIRVTAILALASHWVNTRRHLENIYASTKTHNRVSEFANGAIGKGGCWPMITLLR